MPQHKLTLFDTQRLVVRAATPADTMLYFRLWTDPRVMEHVGFPDGYPITLEEIEVRLKEQKGSEFGRLLVVEQKSTGQAIGECKMESPGKDGIAGTDIKLLPEFWGHGYGTEVKRGLLTHLFTHTDCIAVGTTPNVHNVASIRVQEAVGAVRVGEAVYEFPEEMQDYTRPVHHYVYHVHRSGWEREPGTQPP